MITSQSLSIELVGRQRLHNVSKLKLGTPDTFSNLEVKYDTTRKDIPTEEQYILNAARRLNTAEVVLGTVERSRTNPLFNMPEKPKGLCCSSQHSGKSATERLAEFSKSDTTHNPMPAFPNRSRRDFFPNRNFCTNGSGVSSSDGIFIPPAATSYF